jgi:hypothetical protein
MNTRENRRPAYLMSRALGTFRQLCGSDDIRDFLIALRHWADVNGVDLQEEFEASFPDYVGQAGDEGKNSMYSGG